MSEINMTPLIDVMLVLLVIFMLTAPLMTSALKLDLPQSQASRTDAVEDDVVLVAIAEGGQLYWGDESMTPEQLQQHITQAASRNAQREVQLRADRKVPYGRVAELLGWLQQAGFNRIAFVTETRPTEAAQSPPLKP